jgi:hypothetical protein
MWSVTLRWSRHGVALLAKDDAIARETRLDSRQHSGSERCLINRMAHQNLPESSQRSDLGFARDPNRDRGAARALRTFLGRSVRRLIGCSNEMLVEVAVDFLFDRWF